MFIVENLNLNSISWPMSEDLGNGNDTVKLFYILFYVFDQFISEHNKGRTLNAD